MRWSKSSRPFVTTEFNVLDYNRTDLYGHLLGMFDRLGVLSTLDVTVSQLLDFLVDVDLAYNDTPYHSFYHAADVVSILYFAMTHLEAKSYLTQMEIAVLFVAAVCHDVGHVSFKSQRSQFVYAHCYIFGNSLGSITTTKSRQRASMPFATITNQF